jgi:hypothetical protein
MACMIALKPHGKSIVKFLVHYRMVERAKDSKEAIDGGSYIILKMSSQKVIQCTNLSKPS